jgi:glycosyltransferase involved in cell wall biosynthesis
MNEKIPFFGPAPTALLEGLSDQPQIELHIVSCTKKPMSAPEKLAGNIWFHLLHVKQSGWLRSMYSGCVLAIRKKLREIRPDVVHGQGTERYCALAAALSGFPNLITIHGNMRPIAKINQSRVFSYQWCAAKLERFALPRVDGVICVSSHTKSLVSSITRRTWLVPNAVSSDFFCDRVSDPHARVIVCVGFICRLKNQIALIRALDHLASQQSFRLVFLGKGNDSDPYLHEFLRLVQARPWCAHEGFVDTETLKKFLHRAYALTLPTLEDNCPMVLLEAAAAGVPIMASKVGGIPDLVQDERTGLLFDPYDLNSIASAAQRYLSDSLFAKQMAENARMAAESFRPTIVAKQHLEVYKQLSIEK